MARLQLEIVTPDRVVLKKEVDYVSLPGVEGDFGVLPEHIPYFAALKAGWMHYVLDGTTSYVCLSGGFAEVADNKVQILVDTAELASEVDPSRAEAARLRAEQRLQKAKMDSEINIQRAEAALGRAITRLRAIKLQ